jgi:hypothetical protein
MLRWIGWVVVAVGGCVVPPSDKPTADTATASETPQATETGQPCPPVSGWYDRDADGFGDGDQPFSGCDAPAEVVDKEGDCDDADPLVSPVAEESCDGVDEDCDGGIDEDFADLTGDGVADCGRTTLACYDFQSGLPWLAFGPGNWAVRDGILWEDRAGYYSTVAYEPRSFGVWEHFGIEVDTQFEGSLNDWAGIAWRVSAQNEAYIAVRWDDPRNDYGRHTPPGWIDIASCLAEVCTELYHWEVPGYGWESTGIAKRWGVEVWGDRLIVRLEGGVVLDVVVPPTVSLSGPGILGLYSNDNDGGVGYDNYCAWVEQ